ncbi:MAG: glycerophosphodiester phosphodiesterase [Hydrogenophaga sp.]|jgi:glycerophosphoryl diester phosphodiesterase|nr:glycerophosphodiester phosphodiesterase [Hydrogenophaga sp.]
MEQAHPDLHPFSDRWPYPRWIAHRGAGLLAPENTLTAFALGARHGYRMFECDVKLSADGVPFLLHDKTLERTTSGTGPAGDRSWAELAQLDAGTWHSPAFAGERLLSLDELADWCQRDGCCINLEIKPSPGTERLTGREVARHAAQLWKNAPLPPLLTSFKVDALAGARESAPQLPRGLLLETWWPNWCEAAVAQGCVAVVCKHTLWDDTRRAQARSAGLRTLAYTVNDEDAAERLLALGIDGIITDRVDLFNPAA